MKQNKLIFLAVAAMTALTFSACSSENVVENGPDVNENPSVVSTPKIVFNFTLPVNDQRLVFSRAAVKQDVDEAGVQSLWMYEFEARGGAIIGTPTNIVGDLTPTSASNGVYTYTYSQTTGYADSRARRFIFIANDLAARNNVTNISDLIGTSTEEVEKQLASTGTIATPANDAVWQTINATDVLPMTGEAIRNGNNIIAIDSMGLAQMVNVDLERVVARIDVRNYTPDLTITGLKLIKANPTSYIYPHLDASGRLDIITQTKVDNINSFTAVPANFTKDYNPLLSTDSGYDAAENGYLRKAFYVYEDSTATAADRLTLQVSGYVGNVNVFYNIPFSKSIATLPDGTTTYAALDAANGTSLCNEPVSIKRNHVYTVEVGDGNAIGIHTAVRATIQVKAWDTQEVNETFDPDLFVYTGSVNSAPDDPTTPTGPNATTGVWYHTSSQILDVPYTEVTTDGDLKISVSPNYSNLSITNVEVLAGNTTDPEAWLTATLATGTDAGKYFTITTTQNQKVTSAGPPATYDTTVSTSLRSRSIKVTYTITPTGGAAQTYYTVFTVRQAGYTAP